MILIRFPQQYHSLDYIPQQNYKQLLDEAEQNIQNNSGRGQCYLSKSRVEAQIALIN